MELKEIGRKDFSEMELPETIYKYRVWTTHNHKTIITKRILFMAPPSSFEDPLDCKNPVRWDLLTDEEIFSRYYDDIKEMKPGWKEYQWRNFANQKTKSSPLKDEKLVKKHVEQTDRDFDARFGVLSLTANPNNDQMWKSYSDNYKGFCVGFHPEILFTHLGGGGDVNYVKEHPTIYPKPRHSYKEQHFLLVFSKLEKWSYEQEYRTHKFYPKPTTPDDRQIIIPPEAYKEIIIGKKMDEAMKKDLVDSIPNELKKIQIINQE